MHKGRQGGGSPSWGNPPAPAFPGRGNGKGGYPVLGCRKLISSRSPPLMTERPCAAAHLGLGRRETARRPPRHFLRPEPHHHGSIQKFVHSDIAARQRVPP